MKGDHEARREIRRMFPGVDLARIPNLGAKGNSCVAGGCSLGCCGPVKPIGDQVQHRVAFAVRGFFLATTGSAGGAVFSGGGGVGAGVGRVRQLNLCVETIHYYEGINVTILERMHQFIMYILG